MHGAIAACSMLERMHVCLCPYTCVSLLSVTGTSVCGGGVKGGAEGRAEREGPLAVSRREGRLSEKGARQETRA